MYNVNLHTCCGFTYICNFFISFSVFENKKEFIYSHPKLRKLEEIVIEHFKSWKKGCSGKYQHLKGKSIGTVEPADENK